MMKNNPLNFFWHWKRHGFSKTWADWKYNYIMLDTPEQLMRKEIIGYVGSMAGVVFAGVIFWFKGSKQLIPLFCFSLLILYSNFKRTLKQLYTYNQAKKCLDLPDIPGELKQ